MLKPRILLATGEFSSKNQTGNYWLITNLQPFSVGVKGRRALALIRLVFSKAPESFAVDHFYFAQVAHLLVEGWSLFKIGQK
jgi:hypothetical protein